MYISYIGNHFEGLGICEIFFDGHSCKKEQFFVCSALQTVVSEAQPPGMLDMIYPLAMTNIAMENPLSKEVSSWENHLFLWVIFHGYVK